jgi:4-amino-4-deoxy-L-arabinose transferase-like glycosyltransferase
LSGVRRVLLLSLICVPSFFLFLGSTAITDSDEAYYAEAAREMIESGDWITPHFNYQPRFEKPILFYWMVAGTYTIAGVSEGAARFWSAMSGLGLVLIAYGCGRRWIDEDAGFLAGVITATSFATSAMARQSLPDLPLACFTTLSVWAAFEALEQTEARRSWLLLSAAASALAMLTKGPVGVALPLLIVAIAVVLGYAVAERPRSLFPFRAGDIALAMVVFLLIAVPWYAMVTSVHGVEYLRRFFLTENLDRFATARYNDPRPIWYYVPILIGGLLPWSIFALLWLKRPATGMREYLKRSPHNMRLALWALVPVVFFSISIGKQPRYVLPCLVPLAVLLAKTISERVRNTVKGRRDVALTISTIAAATVFLVIGILLQLAGPLVAATGGFGTRLASVVISGLAILLLLTVRQRSVGALPWRLGAAALVTLVAIHGTLLRPGTDAVVIAAHWISRERSPDTTVCACGAFLRNLPFYVRSRITPAGTQEEVDAVLSRPSPLVAAVDDRKFEAADAALESHFDRIGETQYLNTALLRLDDFIHPDSERVLQRIVVVKRR